MAELNLDLLGLNETVLSFDAFKLKKQYMVKEMAIKPIDSEPRPNRMKKPPMMTGVSTNPTSYFPELYIQDEMRHMLIDKYGRERGEKTFDGLIDTMSSRPGAFFAQGGELAAEKAGLISALGKQTNHDYWQYSYYELWKEWMASINQPVNIATPTVQTPTLPTPPAPTNAQPVRTGTGHPTTDINASIVRAFRALTGKGESAVEKTKSRIRVENLVNGNNALALARKMVNATNEVYKLVQRAYYASEMGANDIAKMFWDKAVSMGVRESVDGNFEGLDIVTESSSLDAETYIYHLSDDGGVSTEWEVPFKLDLKTEFTHEYGRYVVSSFEDGQFVCDRISK